jgi:hypothetical protein
MGSFSLLAAASGFAASYFQSKIVEERKARIERVNEQLREFVGPLLATVATSHSAWAAMVAQTGMGARKFQECVAADPSGEEAGQYRAWMASVLQPLNEKGEFPCWFLFWVGLWIDDDKRRRQTTTTTDEDDGDGKKKTLSHTHAAAPF